MITLTRLSGSVFVLNADLIERLDATPDTVVTLVDGKKYVVAETMTDITAMVRTWRGEIIATSTQLVGSHGGQAARATHLVPVSPPRTSREGEA